jgi:hypothetical protein
MDTGPNPHQQRKRLHVHEPVDDVKVSKAMEFFLVARIIWEKYDTLLKFVTSSTYFS